MGKKLHNLPFRCEEGSEVEKLIETLKSKSSLNDVINKLLCVYLNSQEDVENLFLNKYEDTYIESWKNDLIRINAYFDYTRETGNSNISLEEYSKQITDLKTIEIGLDEQKTQNNIDLTVYDKRFESIEKNLSELPNQIEQMLNQFKKDINSKIVENNVVFNENEKEVNELENIDLDIEDGVEVKINEENKDMAKSIISSLRGQ